MLDTNKREFLLAVLPEAILCTREVGEAARKASYDLLVAMCEANISWNSETPLNGNELLLFIIIIIRCKYICVEFIYRILKENNAPLSLSHWMFCDVVEAVMDFLNMMVAGLAGSPQMMHCTILAITRIIFQYREVTAV